MSKFDFKGTGVFARVNNTEAAIQLFEDYDIPYHLITKGEISCPSKALRNRWTRSHFRIGTMSEFVRQTVDARIEDISKIMELK